MDIKKCRCNVWMTLLGAILMAIAVYLLVRGFSTQFNGGGDIITIIGWYFVGFIILLIAKICKMQGNAECPIHKTK